MYRVQAGYAEYRQDVQSIVRMYRIQTGCTEYKHDVQSTDRMYRVQTGCTGYRQDVQSKDRMYFVEISLRDSTYTAFMYHTTMLYFLAALEMHISKQKCTCC